MEMVLVLVGRERSKGMIGEGRWRWPGRIGGNVLLLQCKLKLKNGAKNGAVVCCGSDWLAENR